MGRSRGAGASTLTAVAIAAFALTACGLTATDQAAGGRIQVVAAENFWGSIAAQVSGDRADVTSLIANPNTDPHGYEPTAADARAIASAKYVIENGAGYDGWVPKLIAANPAPGRRVLDVGALAGVQAGANPHMWYSPDIVSRVTARIASDLAALDATDGAYFAQQASTFAMAGLKDYHDTVASIRSRYSGTPAGATESIFAYMAPAVGLDLITPPDYMKAVSDGSDPSAADKITVDGQVTEKEIKVLVYNSQNSTPEVSGLVNRARAEGIPVVAITETLSPAKATFQDWQTAQLKALLAALGG